MISVVWDKRAFPVYFELLPKLGSSNLDEQKAALSKSLEIFKNYKESTGCLSSIESSLFPLKTNLILLLRSPLLLIQPQAIQIVPSECHASLLRSLLPFWV